MKKVAVLLAEGFETIEALTTVDILRRADVICNTFSIKELEVTTSHNITIKADKILSDEVYDYDAVVLPGGMPGAVNLRDDEKVNEVVKQFYNEDKIVAAICAGPIVLAKAGILKDKICTCSPGFETQLTGANYQEAIVQKDDHIITGRGPAAAVPFAFEILKHTKPEKVEEIKKGMLFNS